MNNKNFDSLNNIKVPESWIENAINIPNVVPKKKPLIFPRINRYLAAVACLVLVCTVSLVIVHNIDRSIVPVKPLVSDNNKDDNKTTEPTKEGVIPTTQNGSDEPTKEPTNSKGDIIPTEKPTDGTDTKPTESTESTDPSDKPSEVPTEPTDKPSVPTEAPTSPPSSPSIPPDPTESTEPPFVEPTEEPWEPSEPPFVEPTEEPWEPSEPPTEDPTPGVPGGDPSSKYPSSGYPPAGSNVFIQIEVNKIPGYNINGEIRLYCEVRDPDNKLLGSFNTFDPKKLVTIYPVKNGVAYGAYSIVNNYDLTKHGRYTANFRDINGNYLYTTYYVY